MTSNVDYTICPECSALNAAKWSPRGRRSYDVICSGCGHEYEHGHFASGAVRLLVHQNVLHDSDGRLALAADQIDEILRGNGISEFEDEDGE